MSKANVFNDSFAEGLWADRQLKLVSNIAQCLPSRVSAGCNVSSDVSDIAFIKCFRAAASGGRGKTLCFFPSIIDHSGRVRMYS